MAIIDRTGRTVDGTDSSARPADPNAGLAIKTPCRAATTANITLSGLQTIDGVTLADAERVLVKNQTDTTLNGVYNASSGNWTRAKDWDGAHEIGRGTRILVTGGTTNALKDFSITSADPLSIGTSAVVIAELAPGPELAALAALATTGLMVRAGVASYTTRSIVGTANEITVANGSGTSANPTLSLPTALTFTGKTVTGGTFSGITLTASDSALTLQDNGDATKQLQFQLSGITTATTRTLTIPDASGTLALTSNKLSAFAATTSAELASVISNETGSGNLVFSASPTFTGTAAFANTTNSGTLAVTGIATIGQGGTSGSPAIVNLLGPNSSAGGAKLVFSKNSVAAKEWYLGHGSAVVGATDDNLVLLSGSSATAVATFNASTLATTLGAALTVTGATIHSSTTTLSGALTYGGVTLNNAVTGTGNMVLSTSASLTTPTLGVATATSINKVNIVAPATSAALQLADGSTLTVNASMTFATAGSNPTITFPTTSGTLATLAGSEALTNKSYNGNTWTAGTGTLTIAAGKTATHNASTTFAGTDGKTLTISNTLTFTGTDSSSVAFGTGGTVLYSGGALGTPSSGVATNLTGTASGLTAGNVTTNANLTGDVTSVGNATTLTNAPVIAKVLTAYSAGAGTVASTDSILQAFQKIGGLVDNAAWSTYTSTFSASTGTATVTARQKTVGKTVFVNIQVAFTSAVTGTFTVTLPATNNATNYSIITGKEISGPGPTGGHAAGGYVAPSSNVLNVLDYAGTQFLTNGSTIVLNGSYEST